MNEPIKTQRRLGRGMIYLAWIAALGLVWLGFEYQFRNAYDPNRNLSIQPGQTELELKRSRGGHYIAPGTINGQEVRFLVDTGATMVSVPARLADELGLVPGGSARVTTANGTVTVRSTRIDELRFGPFTVTNAPAHLNPGMHQDEILLGMSVLRHLEFTQRGDTLILRPQTP